MELASVTKILIDQLVIHADCTVFHVYITPCQIYLPSFPTVSILLFQSNVNSKALIFLDMENH